MVLNATWQRRTGRALAVTNVERDSVRALRDATASPDEVTGATNAMVIVMISKNCVMCAKCGEAGNVIDRITVDVLAGLSM